MLKVPPCESRMQVYPEEREPCRPDCLQASRAGKPSVCKGSRQTPRAGCQGGRGRCFLEGLGFADWNSAFVGALLFGLEKAYKHMREVARYLNQKFRAQHPG